MVMAEALLGVSVGLPSGSITIRRPVLAVLRGETVDRQCELIDGEARWHAIADEILDGDVISGRAPARSAANDHCDPGAKLIPNVVNGIPIQPSVPGTPG